MHIVDANSRGWTTFSPAFTEGSPEASVTLNGSARILVGLDGVYRTTDMGSGALDALRGHWEGEDTFVVDQNQPGYFQQWQYRLAFPGDRIVVEAREQVTGATETLTGRVAP